MSDYSNQPVVDVAIIGGGLAGLRCALTLQEAGREVVVLEADARVGGRVRTDEVDGFLLDRGFQVLLTAYEETRQVIDLDTLDLHRFEPGAIVRRDGGFHRLADPWRSPQHLLSTLRSPVASLFDKLRVGLLRIRVGRGPVQRLFDRPERTTLDHLRRLGFSPIIIERFFRPFLGGVFLESELRTSSRFFEFVFRMFACGDVALPAAGMQAIPNAMAAKLPEGTVRTRRRVKAITRVDVPSASDSGLLRGSLLRLECEEPGAPLLARSVVVATDGTEVERWFPDMKPPRSRSVTCVYFAADRSPVNEPILVLNGDGRGPINNLCVPSDVVPAYAPDGRALVSATVLGDNERVVADDVESQVRRQLKEWFGTEADQWQHLRTYEIGHALPEFGVGGSTVPSSACRSVPRRRGGETEAVFVCGDYCESPSIEGAIISGRRAAEAVLDNLTAC